MINACQRVIYDPAARFPYPAAEIEIVVVKEKILVEISYFIQHRGPYEEACPDDKIDINGSF